MEQGQVANFISGHCSQRYFERLPGYVDANIYSIDGMQTLLPEVLKTAVPICILREPEPMHIAVYESIRE